MNNIPLDPTAGIPRDKNGFTFLAHIPQPLSQEEQNFSKLSEQQLIKDLDEAHAARALVLEGIPAGKIYIDPAVGEANKQWSISAKKAEAFHEARRDYFYNVHLQKPYPGQPRIGDGKSVRLNPYQHGDPQYLLRSQSLQHAEHWCRRMMSQIVAPTPPKPLPSPKDIQRVKQRMLDELVREQLKREGFAA